VLVLGGEFLGGDEDRAEWVAVAGGGSFGCICDCGCGCLDYCFVFVFVFHLFHVCLPFMKRENEGNLKTFQSTFPQHDQNKCQKTSALPK